MTLNDEIIDEAEELAANKVLMPHATRAEIAEAISDIVGVNLAPDSQAALLAEAAYNRYALLQEVM